MSGKKSYAYETMEEVESAINDGILYTHAVRKKDRASRPSDCYNVFHLVYDEHHTVVPNFYFCSMCETLYHMILHDGTHEMKRHKCYRVYEAKNAAKQKSQMKRLKKMNDLDSSFSTSSSEDDFIFANRGGNKNVGELVSEFSKLCTAHGPISIEYAKHLIPSTWKVQEWYVK